MKREFIVAGMIACLAVGLLGGWFIPSPLGAPSRTPLLDIIKARGYIIIGTNTPYEPFEYINTSAIPEEIVGFDVDLCNWIAEELGVAIQWSDRGFAGLVVSCAEGKVDMLAAAMGYTENRSNYLAPSSTYITVGHAVIVANETVLSIANLTELEGTQVGVQSGTTLYDELVAAGVTTITQYGQVDAMMLALIGGAITAAYIDEPVYTAWAKDFDLKIVLHWNTEDFSLWTRHGEPELLYVINNVILDSFIDGRMYDSLAKYNLTG